jgi:hypothetical protein
LDLAHAPVRFRNVREATVAAPGATDVAAPAAGDGGLVVHQYAFCEEVVLVGYGQVVDRGDLERGLLVAFGESAGCRESAVSQG